MDYLEKNKELMQLLNSIKLDNGIKRERATKKFLEFYNPFVSRILYSYRNPYLKKEDIEDISSNILLGLLKETCSIDKNILGYLYVSVKNYYKNFLLSNINSINFERGILFLIPSLSAGNPETITDFKMKLEHFYYIHRKKREPAVQEQFNMKMLGYNHREISDKLNISTGASKKNIFRVRHQEGKIFFQ